MAARSLIPDISYFLTLNLNNLFCYFQMENQDSAVVQPPAIHAMSTTLMLELHYKKRDRP